MVVVMVVVVIMVVVVLVMFGGGWYNGKFEFEKLDYVCLGFQRLFLFIHS